MVCRPHVDGELELVVTVGLVGWWRAFILLLVSPLITIQPLPISVLARRKKPIDRQAVAVVQFENEMLRSQQRDQKNGP